MYNQGPDFGTICLYIALFFVAVFIIRWIFRIDRILTNLDKQYEINKLIAYKLGVENMDIKKIDDYEEYYRLKIIEQDLEKEKINSN
jgi:hypothetical protein